MKAFINKLQFYLLYGIVFICSLQPMWLHYIYSDILYFIIRYIVGYRKRIVRKNLRSSFPEKTDRERKEIEKRFYAFFCDYIVENIKLLTMRKKNIMKRMTFEGLEEIDKSFREHDLVFIYLGHYCNWEYVASLQWWVPKEIHCAQLYSNLKNYAFDQLFLKIRSRYGGDNIKKNESIRHIVTYKEHHEKAIIGFISDQTPRWINIHKWLNFLHQDTPVFTGTERIAKKVNAAVYYGEMTRTRRGYYHCTFKLMTNDACSMKDEELTTQYMHLLEESIQREPAYWLWTHNRWKRQRQQKPEE